jgi:hypothetical protein
VADEPVTPPWWQPYTAEFPDWEAWRAASGLLYARKIGSSPALIVRGEDPVDLRDEIIRAESKELPAIARTLSGRAGGVG